MSGRNTDLLSKQAPVSLAPSFLDLLQLLPGLMATPTFNNLLTILAG